MSARLLAVAAGGAAALSTSVSSTSEGITRVIKMLNTLSKETSDSKAAEQEIWEKYSCWAKDFLKKTEEEIRVNLEERNAQDQQASKQRAKSEAAAANVATCHKFQDSHMMHPLYLAYPLNCF